MRELRAWRLVPSEVRTEIEQEIAGFCSAAIPGFDPSRVPAHMLLSVGLWCVRELLRIRRDREGGRSG